MVTSAAAVELRHLDNLWLQVTGTHCNIDCRHCFNNSGPRATTFGHMTFEAVTEAIAAAAARGVRDIYFTGGEPFLHAQLLDMIACALAVAPTTVLTNGTLISDRIADALASLATAARYSLEVRVRPRRCTTRSAGLACSASRLRGRSGWRGATSCRSSPSFERGMTRASWRRSPGSRAC
jgi:hypothetical protein